MRASRQTCRSTCVLNYRRRGSTVLCRIQSWNSTTLVTHFCMRWATCCVELQSTGNWFLPVFRSTTTRHHRLSGLHLLGCYPLHVEHFRVGGHRVWLHHAQQCTLQVTADGCRYLTNAAFTYAGCHDWSSWCRSIPACWRWRCPVGRQAAEGISGLHSKTGWCSPSFDFADTLKHLRRCLWWRESSLRAERQDSWIYLRQLAACNWSQVSSCQ